MRIRGRSLTERPQGEEHMGRHAVINRVSRRFAVVPTVLAAGVLGAALLAGSTTGTLSGFVASVTGTTNSAGDGVLTMAEQTTTGTVLCSSTDGTSITSTNSASCAGVNKFGGGTTLTPGDTVSTTVVIKNTGTVAAKTFAVSGGACTPSFTGTPHGAATNICSTMTLVISSPNNPNAYTGTVGGLAAVSKPLAVLAANTSETFTFTVGLPSSADNTYQGLAASMPVTWTFTA
jgi:hypothetical protein